MPRRLLKKRGLLWLALILAVGVWFALAGSAAGQSETSKEPTSIELEPVVITGTFIPTGLAKSPASVTVITTEQIEARQASSVTELLRAVPGLHIDQAGGRGSVSSVYLRGGDPNYTVVLIDGLKVNDPTNSRGGSFDFATLNLDNIERIEIVRGPLSSIYGSDAMAGVINIITHRGTDKPVNSLAVSGGSFGYYRSLLETRGRLDRGDYSLSGSYLDNGEPVEGSDFVNKTFQANFGVLLSDTAEIRSVLRYADSHLEAFPDDSGGPLFAELRDVDERDVNELTIGTEFSYVLFPRWHTSLHLGYYDRQEEIDSPGITLGGQPVFPPNTSDNQYRRYNVSLRNLFLVTQGLRLTIGLEAQSEEGSSRGTTSFELERDLWALFIEAQHRLPARLLLYGGARLDVPEGFDSEVSPRLGVSYEIPLINTRLRAGWARGFKLPSFFALGHPLVGDPTLVPEKSRSADASVIQPLWGKHVNISATYFSNRFENAIDFQEDISKLVNRSEITTEGVEMAINARAGRGLDLSSHLTYVKTDIKGTVEELRNRPKWRGGFTVRWRPLSSLVLNFDALYIGKVHDSSIPTGDLDLDAYTRLNLAVTWTKSPTWQYFVAVDNLFNADYEEAVGFPAPGISLRIGLRASL